jgi:hypothetical protein
MFEIKYLSRQRILFTQWRQTCYLESEYKPTELNLHLIKYIYTLTKIIIIIIYSENV